MNIPTTLTIPCFSPSSRAAIKKQIQSITTATLSEVQELISAELAQRSGGAVKLTIVKASVAHNRRATDLLTEPLDKIQRNA